MTFLAVSAEPRKGTQQLLAMHFSRPDAQGRGVKGEGKPSPNTNTWEIYSIPGKFTRPVQDLTRPGPRPGEFLLLFSQHVFNVFSNDS